MIKQKIVFWVKIFIYASFFAPLVVMPSSFIFPFIVPKIIILRSLIMLMLGAYVLLLTINWQEFKPRFSVINLVLASFLVSFFISTFVGVDPYHSFWDNHERMLGAFTIFHYITYFFICSAVLKTWTEWKTALRIFLIGGSLVMFIGVLQVFNPQMLLNQGSARVASTLGNSIYVGGYGLFLFFVSFLLFMRDKSSTWRWVYAAASVLAIAGMFFSGTRGSMIGWIAGIGVLIIGYAFALKENKKLRKILWITAAVALVLLVVVYINRKSAFISNMPAVGRTFNTSLSDVQNSPRWIAWTIAIESWKEKPIFGWGPNNFFYAFNAHYLPRSLEFGYGETWFDNAHNIIVNTMAVQGTVGIITYLSIFILTIASLILAYRKKQVNVHILIVGSAFLVAHLTQNVTVFENPTSYLYFMFWLAMLNALSLPVVQPVDPKNKKPAIPDKNIGNGLITTVSLFALLLVFIFNIQPARANMKTLAALKAMSSDPKNALASVQDALSFNSPHIDDIRSDLGRTLSQIIGSNNNNGIDKEVKIQLFDPIFQALKENLILHPLDIRNQMALFQLAQIGYGLYGNPQMVYDSVGFLEDALKYSPRRQQIIYNLANVKLQTNQIDEAVKLLEGTINDDPKINEGYWRLAYTYKISGNIQKAIDTLALANKNGIVFTENENQLIAQILGGDQKNTSATVTSTPVKVKAKAGK